MAWLGKPAYIIGLIGFYLAAHFALRLILSPTLGIDDAEQVLFAQQWAFGYRFRQPPLFTWLLMPVIEVIGPGVPAVSLVRYGLLAITYLFLYLTARRCFVDQRLAGLAVLSFASIYVFAYYAHHDLTHTTALGAMIALALYVTIRLIEHPSWTAYAAAGLVFGLGMLAKWNFAMLAIGLPLACLVMPRFRHLVLTWKVLATIAMMAAVLAPTALWMFAQGQSVGAVSSDILVRDGGAEGIALLLEGAGALFRAILLFPLPFLLLFLLVFHRKLRADNQASNAETAPIPATFFAWLILITLSLHVLLIPAFGAVNFTERWMHPALMPLPIVLFALIEHNRPSSRQIAAFLVMIAILVAVAAGARLYRYAAGADDCDRCREFVPFAELAEGLRGAGFVRGTIVADGMHIGGNLKMLFADSRVIDPAFPRALWPDADDHEAAGSCLLAWREDSDDPGGGARRQALLQRYAAQQLGLPVTARPETGRLEAPLIGSTTRRYALGFALYREDSGGCR